MTDLADEIYEATGMILGTQQAAAMTAFVRTREAAARHEAADEIERLWAALRHLSGIALEAQAAARREGIEAAALAAANYQLNNDDCVAAIRALLTENEA